MPYSLRNTGKGARPVKIIRQADGKVVGSSTSKAKADASVRMRMQGEERK